jgi:hypothetical protein
MRDDEDLNTDNSSSPDDLAAPSRADEAVRSIRSRVNGKVSGNGRGRSDQERPRNGVAGIQDQLDALVGAEPAQASREPSPPDAEVKEQSNGEDVDAETEPVNEAPRRPRKPRSTRAPYSDADGCIVWLKQTHTKEGVATDEVQLANFSARIISDITKDDGIEVMRWYEIAATLNGRAFRFEVQASKFASMHWVNEHLGAKAIISPGQGLQSKLAHAIQLLSVDMLEERFVYAHLGWREIDGANYFLDALGAIGIHGRRNDIEVAVPEQLAKYQLIIPEDDAELVRAVRETLLLQKLAPMRVMSPLLASVFRGPIGGSDITVAPYGQTGRGKTETAAILQQHFGPGMDARHLPLSWESTANTIEWVLSSAKDVPTVVDEFVPGENLGARAQLQSKAERVIRAQGNAAARGRMRADLTLRPARPPRGQLISTGEEMPAGQSLRARMMGVEFRSGDLDWERMTEAQALAADGTYATAIGGFVVWLASRLDEVQAHFQAQRLAFRKQTQAEHKRTADVVAQLAASWDVFIGFALDVGAIDKNAAKELWDRVWAGLLEVTAEQALLQQAAEPTAKFRDLILAAISTGRAHVADSKTGREPPNAEQWGWRRREYEWQPQGDCIGWLEGGEILFLEPDVAYATVSKIGSIPVSSETLGLRLADKGVIVTERESDGGRRARVKRRVNGKRPRVYHFKSLGWLLPGKNPPLPSAETGAFGASGSEEENDDALH